MDCAYIKIPFRYKELALINQDMLKEQLSRAKPPVVTVLHHAPQRGLLHYTGDPERDFLRAYDGSEGLGRLLMRYRDKLAAVVYGHLHEYSRSRVAVIEGIPHVNAYPVHRDATGLAVIEVSNTGEARIFFIS